MGCPPARRGILLGLGRRADYPHVIWPARQALPARLLPLPSIGDRQMPVSKPGRWSSLLRIAGGLVFAALLTLSPARAADTDKKIDFSHDVLPVLKARCSECHTNGKYKGSFSLDTREDILKTKSAAPGK